MKADKSAGWLERNMAEGFSKVASGASLVFFSLPHTPRFLLNAGLGGRLHTHTPPCLNWSFQACASAWQKGLAFRAGTRQSLRVWWKNEAVLMELPYGSKHSLAGI